MKTLFGKSILMLALLCSTFDVCAQTAVEASNPNDVCAETWAKYQQANTLWKTGWGLFGVGLALSQWYLLLPVRTKAKNRERLLLLH